MKLISKTLVPVLAVLLSYLHGMSAAGASAQTTLVKAKTRSDFAKLLAAAEKGDAKAQYDVGLAYECPDASWQGVVLHHDYFEAEKWYRKAAEQGLAWAQNSLGCLYYGRDFVSPATRFPPQPEKALKWLRKAAEQDDSCGQVNLGRFYRNPSECFGIMAFMCQIPADKVQAYKWLTLSTRSRSSQEEKEGIESEIAELAGTMNPQQIALAERFVREFIAGNKQPSGATEEAHGGGESPKASGSGFFISDDGALLTNFHVVDGASRIVVNTKRGSFPAKVLKLDSANDIAIIKVSGSAFKSLPMIPSRGAKLADSVFTIGFPNPEMQGKEPKFTDGKISSLSGVRIPEAVGH